ncbi:MAG: hypothetical protein B193_2153, partial [Solidesulfovibrio magneticus str. Maddingley MBC34]
SGGLSPPAAGGILSSPLLSALSSYNPGFAALVAST